MITFVKVITKVKTVRNDQMVHVILKSVHFELGTIGLNIVVHYLGGPSKLMEHIDFSPGPISSF